MDKINAKKEKEITEKSKVSSSLKEENDEGEGDSFYTFLKRDKRTINNNRELLHRAIN